MTDKLLQASDAAALVRQNIDGVVSALLDNLLEHIDYSASRALTAIIADEHANPDVQESLTKKLEALGYRVQALPENEMKISWSK